jgi:spermidine/putrescine transport system permease protein
LAPLVVIVLFSFHSSQSLSFPFEGFSLRWYEEILKNPQLSSAIIKSLIIAAATSVTTLVLGTMFSLAWLRLAPRSRVILETLCVMPIAFPGLFVGVSLLLLFAQIKLPLSTVTIVASHVLLALPMLVVAMRARLALFDPSLEEASRDLGASVGQTFARITLPLILPTLAASSILAFAVSFDEFVVTAFVAGTETTLPMFVWSMMRRTVTPMINAVSTLALVFTALIFVLAWAIGWARRNTALGARMGSDGE